jgi:chromosome segregation ATPase
MNEEERRLEILKAEAAIRELAGRMAEAGECTRHADMARSALEAAARSIDELSIEFHSSIESSKGALEEESKSMNQARESLDICARDVQKSQELLGKTAANLENSQEKKNQEFYEMIDAKLDNLSQDINNAQEHLSKKTDHLETSIVERSQETHELLDAKLGNLSQDINTISDKLLFVMDQNEALNKRILALQQIIEELSCKFHGFGNAIACNSEEIQELRTQVIDSNEKLSSLEYGLEAKTSGLVHRLRSAIRLSWS